MEDPSRFDVPVATRDTKRETMISKIGQSGPRNCQVRLYGERVRGDVGGEEGDVEEYDHDDDTPRLFEKCTFRARTGG